MNKFFVIVRTINVNKDDIIAALLLIFLLILNLNKLRKISHEKIYDKKLSKKAFVYIDISKLNSVKRRATIMK